MLYKIKRYQVLKKPARSKVSNNKIIIIYHFILSFIDVQFDNIAIGIIIVVNKIKYIDNPSKPK